jgi:large exoprotein involved in heme utilization and adhesion
VPELDIPSGILGLTFTEENAGNVGNINIRAGQMTLAQGAQILNRTFGAGNSGTIDISVDGAITIAGEDVNGTTSGIAGQSGSEEIANLGNAADIVIQAQQITLADGAGIASDTFGFGNGGDIAIRLTDSLNISGQDSVGSSSAISASSLRNGHAGNVDIAAKQITLTAGGAIYSATLGSGNAGSIDIQADQVQAFGGFDKAWEKATYYNDSIRFLPSGIFTTSIGKTFDIGDAGPIKIEARQITLLDGGEINSGTYGGGDGNTIELIVTDKIIADGKYTREELFFNSGIITNSITSESYAGNAGNLIVHADSILLSNYGAIATNAHNANGGNINLNINNLLYLRDANITTSVNGGDGNGGNINIGNSQFVVLDDALIIAQADAGHGGNIRIVADQFITSKESLISASSRLGIDGEVKIDSPEVNMEGFLVILPGGFIEEAELPKPCQFQDVSELSTFKKRTTREGMPMAPSGFQE